MNDFLEYECKYFTVPELIHPQILAAIGETNSLIRLDPDCLRDLDTIREAWHKKHKSGVYCNRVKFGIDSRGLRPPNDPDGGFYSTHKQGTTFDLEPVNGKHKEFFLFLVELINSGKLKAFNTMEDRKFTPTWSHLAKMNHSKKLLIINK